MDSIRALMRSVLLRAAILLVEGIRNESPQHPRMKSGPEFQRVLVIRLDEIGDMIMTFPMLRELKKNLPSSHVTLIVKPAVLNLVEHSPCVDRVLTYQPPLTPRVGMIRRYLQAARFCGKNGLTGTFDLALVPRWDYDASEAPIMAYFSRAQVRAGYSERVNFRKAINNRGYDRLLTHAFRDTSVDHEVNRNLGLAKALGLQTDGSHLELWLHDADNWFAEEFLDSRGFTPDDSLIALGIGAGSPRRQWPMHRFIELGGKMLAERDVRLLVVGGPGEKALGSQVTRALGPRALNAVGVTLRQAGALLQLCRLFVGNDSGAMHLAAAAGIPVVEISCHPLGGDPLHANSPLRFGPYGVASEIIRPKRARSSCKSGCGRSEAHCILEVQVNDVYAAARRLLSLELQGERAAPEESDFK